MNKRSHSAGASAIDILVRGTIVAILVIAAGVATHVLAQPVQAASSGMEDTKASGVTIRIKPGAKATAAEIAARNKVAYDEMAPGMFGAIKLNRKELVPFDDAAADAARLRADPDVESASANYVIEAPFKAMR